jgi:hypothetical protein
VYGADRRVVLDVGAAADDDLVSELAPFAHASLVADDDSRAERCAREDDRPCEDGASVTDHEGRQLAARGRRALSEDGLFADHGVVADDDVFPSSTPG